MGEGPVTENVGVDKNVTIVDTDKFVLLRDMITIPCGPDLPPHSHLESILPSLPPSSVTPVSPTIFLLLREKKVFMGPRPLPTGYFGLAYIRPERMSEQEPTRWRYVLFSYPPLGTLGHAQ
jgi:hypothetical protein